MLIQSAACGKKKNTMSTHFGIVIVCQGCIVQTFFFLPDCPKNVSGSVFFFKKILLLIY